MMTVQKLISRVRLYFTSNTSRRRKSQTQAAQRTEQVEPRLLLTTLEGTDPTLGGNMYGDQAEIVFSSQTPQLSFSDGMPGPNRPAFYRTTGIGRPSTNQAGIQYNTYALNWDFVKPGSNGGTVPSVNLDGEERNIRVTIDESVPFNLAHGREVMRIINLPNQFSAQWQRVNENYNRVDLDREQAGDGTPNQVGRDFEVRTYQTQQFRTVIRNGQNEIVRTIEWRRLTTSSLRGNLTATNQIEFGNNATLTFSITNDGNLPYNNNGSIRYLISNSPQKPGFYELLDEPQAVALGEIAVNQTVIQSVTVPDLTPGAHYVHWVIDSAELPDWKYNANPTGSGSGASVRERDSLANKNFPVVPDNNLTNSAEIIVRQTKVPPVVEPPESPAPVVVDEGIAGSRSFRAFDPDGGPVVQVVPSIGTVSGSSPNFIWSYDAVDAVDDRGPIPVSLTATDDEGMTTTQSFDFTVRNVAPSFGVISTATIDENNVATITGSFTDPGVLDTHTLVVNWGDGSSSPATIDPATRTFTASRQYTDDNPTGTPVDVYNVSLTLTDDDGASVVGGTTVTVNNVDPEITDFQISDVRLEGTEIVVTSDATDRSPDDELTYSYEILKDGVAFDAGSDVDLQEFRFTPDDDGMYRVTLTVSDDDNGLVAASQEIQVANVGPVIPPLENCTIHEGESVTLDLTNIIDPGDDTVSEILIDWGDGNLDELDGPGVISHPYTDNGNYQISITLYDEDGEWTGTGPSVTGYLNAVASTPNLLSRYELDGSIDDTLNQRDGVISGSPGFVPGLIGDALEASNGNYGHVQRGTAYVPQTESFSASMHFLLEQPSAPLSWAPLLVMQQSDFSEGFLLQLGTTTIEGDTLNLVLQGGPKGSQDFQLVQFVFDDSQLGEWHHVGFTVDRDDGTVTLYFDGEAKITEPLTVSSLDPTKGMFIGQYDFTFGRNGHPRFVGGDSMLLDEVLLFDGALSAEQIAPLSLTGGYEFRKNVKVENVNPTANDDSFDVLEDDGVAPLDVLANDTDPAGANDPLQVISVDTTNTLGEVAITAAGVTYSPNGQFESLATGEIAADTFTYTIDDGDGGTSTATVTVTVTGQNDAPTANPDFATTTENEVVTTDVIANDTDPDVSDVLSLVAPTTLADATADFSLTQNPNGPWSYHSSDDTLRDGDYPLMEETAPLDLPGGGPVVWHSDSTSTAIRPFVGIKTFDVAGLGSWQIDELAIHPGRSQRVQGPGLVVLTYTADNDGFANIDYDLELALNGNVLWFVEKNDSSETLASGAMSGTGATASIDLDTVPVVAGDRINLVIDSNGSEGRDLIRVLRGEIALSSPIEFSATLDSDGSVIPMSDATVTQNGNELTFDPGTDFDFLATGETATVVVGYSVTDDDVLPLTDDGTLTIAVVGTNDAPVAVGIDATVDEDGPAVFLTADFTDADVTDVHTFSVDTANTTGTVTNIGDGTFNYDPNGQFESLAVGETATDIFDYTVDDGFGGNATATATVTILGQNDAPIAVDIVDTVDENGPAISLAADFSDVDASDTHTFDLEATGTVGTVVNNGDGTFGYDPNGQFEWLAIGETTTDIFTWTATDNHGALATGVAVITIVGSNDAPTLTVTSSSDSLESKSNDGTVSVLGSFTDLDDSDLHDAIVDWGDGTTSAAFIDPANRTLSADHEYADGGIYGITVTLTDGNGGVDVQTTQAVVQGIGLVDGKLYVIGTNERDHVKIRTQHGRLTVKSKLGGNHQSATFAVDDVTKVIVLTCAGADHIDVLTPSHILVHVESGDGNDHILTANGNDFIDAGNGRDHICSFGGEDVIFAGAGHDHVWAGAGDDFVDAGHGADVVFGENGDDLIYGRNGMDDINGGRGEDVIFGGSGADWLSGDDGNDFIDGGRGHDMIKGGHGHDVLIGGTGQDRIFGGHGNDVLIGGRLSIDWDLEEDLAGIDLAMLAWAGGDLAATLDELGAVVDDKQTDRLYGGRGWDRLLFGRRDW